MTQYPCKNRFMILTFKIFVTSDTTTEKKQRRLNHSSTHVRRIKSVNAVFFLRTRFTIICFRGTQLVTVPESSYARQIWDDYSLPYNYIIHTVSCQLSTTLFSIDFHRFCELKSRYKVYEWLLYCLVFEESSKWRHINFIFLPFENLRQPIYLNSYFQN